MGSSCVTWMCGAVAPWCLAVGLIVSFTAEAGQDVPSGASAMPLSSHAPAMPADLIPQTRLALADFTLGRGGNGMLQASLGYGGNMDAGSGVAEELAPKTGFKTYVRLSPGGKPPQLTPLPGVDRERRSDPLVALRPAFDARLRGDKNLLRARTGNLLFGTDAAGIASAFTLSEGNAPGPESVASFEPWPEGEGATTRASHADVSPGAHGSSMTGAAIVSRDGATPVRGARGGAGVVHPGGAGGNAG